MHREYKYYQTSKINNVICLSINLFVFHEIFPLLLDAMIWKVRKLTYGPKTSTEWTPTLCLWIYALHIYIKILKTLNCCSRKMKCSLNNHSHMCGVQTIHRQPTQARARIMAYLPLDSWDFISRIQKMIHYFTILHISTFCNDIWTLFIRLFVTTPPITH